MPKSTSKQPVATNPSDIFETQSLYQGAFCLCRNLPLIGKKRDGTKVTLIFRGERAHEIAMEFYAKAKVEAKAYAEAFRSLKDYVFER